MSDSIFGDTLKLLDLAKNEMNKIDNINSSDPYRIFNIFNVLDIKSKEVIMCRFLSELLTPNGSHGMGKKFFEKFIEAINEDENINLIDDDLDCIRVTTEKVIKDNRRIDILIKTSKQIIPIEVKIYAGEQQYQVKDYLEYCKNYIKLNKLDSNRCVLLYLTLDGHPPSCYSTGSSDEQKSDARIICISFKKHILNFLQKCLEECERSESEKTAKAVSSNIKQYQFAIEELTGVTSLNKSAIEAVATQIIGKKEFVAIQYLEAAQEHRKLKLMSDIFNSVEDKLIKEYQELKNSVNLIKGYSDEGSKQFQHDTKLKNFYKSKSGIFPCLCWNYGKITDPYNNNVELDVVIALEFDWRPYVGVLLTYRNSKNQFYNLFYTNDAEYVEGSFKPKDKSIIEKIKKEFENKMQLSESGTWWIDWCRVSAIEMFAEEKDSPDFKTAFSEDYFQLYDEETMNSFTKNIVERFKLYKEVLDSLVATKVIRKN